MDKTAIKNFSVWARRKLIEDVKQKAYEIGITENMTEEAITVSSDLGKVKGRTLNKNELKQRQSLISKIQEKGENGYQEVIEEVAYTWFNRFIALRFMEVNEYLPSGVRVLSSIQDGKVEPDIISQFEYIDLNLSEDDLKTLHAMQDLNDIDNLYRFLLVKQCNKLNEILPGLFEQIEDYTELLLPNNLLLEGSVIRRLVSDIPEEDYKDQVEIIGWLYQYYISEKKDEVFEGLKKNIKITKENIPAATQLFTPDWIVKYMVENSLGRLWLEGRPNDDLKSGWKYYLDEVEQETDVQKQLDEIREKSKKIRPEDIKVMDPAMGSGHILVYAFDVLYEIYKSAGYSEKDIPKLILEKNLYGLEIDDRAAQLSYFAVMMKARSKSRRIFREKIDLNICSIQESNGIPEKAIDLLTNPRKTELENWVDREDVEYLLNTFVDAKEYGSILDVKPIEFDAIEKRLDEIKNGDLPLYELEMKNLLLEKIPPLVKQARIMSQKYDVVCTNPPYMGTKGMNSKLANYLDRFYHSTKADLFATFIQKGFILLKDNGFNAMVTMQSWMFLSSFEIMRKEILTEKYIISLVNMANMVMGIAFGTVATVWRNGKLHNYKGIYSYIELEDINNGEPYEFPIKNNRLKYVKMADYLKIQGYPIAYWICDKVRDIFNYGTPMKNIAGPKKGLITSDNNRFLKLWFEVDYNNIGFNYSNSDTAYESRRKWFPHNKGGTFRKWYGNNEYVINWYDNGKEIKEYASKLYKSYSRQIMNEKYYFHRSVSWTSISSSKLGVRFYPYGYIFDTAGPSIFGEIDTLYYIIGFMCSKLCFEFLKILNPTLNILTGDIANMPIIFPKDRDMENRVFEISQDNIRISKTDWDFFEISWDFSKHPILKYKMHSNTMRQAFENYQNATEKQFNTIKANEEDLNRIFIIIYGLENEFTPEIDDKEITIRKSDRVRDIKSFISYAVGCMLGRYSIDTDGLIYAGGEWKSKWKVENEQERVRKIVKDNDGNIVENTWVDASFVPDEDNIIPITDDEYFTDDIVSRFVEFVQATFGEETLEENLDYIAETIGRKSSETSRQTIRRYFVKDFYKDHVQIYQKRPIYWLFDSGKNDGFKALIYMHRYDEFTVSRVRTDYLHKLQHMYESEYNRLDIVIESNASEREKANARKKKEKLQKQMAECLQYDQVIAHVANQRINIDLDDGVKVNYEKFQNIEVPQGEGRKPLKADLLAKI